MKRMTMRLEYRNLSTNKEKESERGKDQLRRLKGRQSETTTEREGASKRERDEAHVVSVGVSFNKLTSTKMIAKKQ